MFYKKSFFNFKDYYLPGGNKDENRGKVGDTTWAYIKREVALKKLGTMDTYGVEHQKIWDTFNRKLEALGLKQKEAPASKTGNIYNNGKSNSTTLSKPGDAGFVGPVSSGGTTKTEYENFKIGTVDTPYSSTMLDDIKLSNDLYDTKSEKDIGEWLKIRGILARAWGNVLGGNVPLFVNKPVASDLLRHFLSNTGKKYEINFAQLLNDTPIAYEFMLKDIDLAMEAAENLAVNGKSVNIVSKNDIYQKVSPEDGVPLDKSNEDWWFALGRYRTWIKASVTKSGDTYTMNVQYNLRDFYDWKLGSNAPGGLVTDGEMALLHQYGKAKQFEVYGVYNTTVTWKQGQRYSSGSVYSSDESARRRDNERRQRR